MTSESGKQYVCVNCGSPARELIKKYSNTIKPTNCCKCNQLIDKYIEVEEFIILIDALLLDSAAFRHMIFNGNFKLYWKISLVVLLLESFALCRQKRGDGSNTALYEKGFYMCTLQSIGEYLLITLLLLFISALLNLRQMNKVGHEAVTLIILKVVAISNFSKFFLLPILVWRSNTTDFGQKLHYMLVTGHHLCSLIMAYSVVGISNRNLRCLTAILVIFAFAIKEYVRYLASFKIELYLS
ncbi:protein ARV1 [Drosophila grimshawi]|uniref:Protein ARV n=1 Tax=Drosophila grimshawi TaxID=7222 RepID=B4J3E9_DROGR|nr:protein ARV1 [Drosophila grimshawi]EDV97248.1 GH16742 [Drosophila grimshawi]